MICDVTYELLIDKVQVPVLRSLDKFDLVHTTTTTYNNYNVTFQLSMKHNCSI